MQPVHHRQSPVPAGCARRATLIAAALAIAGCAAPSSLGRLPRSAPASEPVAFVPQVIAVSADFADAALSSHGTLGALAEASGNVLLLDLQRGKLLGRLRPHDDLPIAISFLPDDNTVVSAARDGSVCRIDLPLRRVTECLGTSPSDFHSGALPAQGRLVLAGNHLAAGELTLEEDDRVRDITYR